MCEAGSSFWGRRVRRVREGGVIVLGRFAVSGSSCKAGSRRRVKGEKAINIAGDREMKEKAMMRIRNAPR